MADTCQAGVTKNNVTSSLVQCRGYIKIEGGGN